MAALGGLFILGLYIDGWAHNHLEGIETFFTPWHALFYGSFLLLALVFGAYVAAGLSANLQDRSDILKRWARAIPRGYEWSALGVGLFFVSGACDMLWHLRFGIEQNTEALLSPTHLGLATAMALILTGPLRAAIARGDDVSGAQLWPAVISFTSLFCGLTFILQFSPALVDWGVGVRPTDLTTSELMLDRAVVSQLLISTVMTGAVLFLVRQWGTKLPFGSLTVLIGANAALMSVQSGHRYYFAMLPAAIGAAVIADCLNVWLLPTESAVRFRWFAFLVPFVYWSAHYLDYLVRGESVWWKIHVWAGLPVIAGLIGLLLSFLAISSAPIPRAEPADTRA